MDSDGYESCEDGYYDGDGDGDGDGDFGFAAHDLSDSDERPSSREERYTILSEADIRKLLEEDITRLSNVLSISSIQSCILLCHYNWNFDKAHDEWFADEGNVRHAVGLLQYPAVMPNARELTCKICFEMYQCREMSAAACGHQFCHGCWRGYIGSSINDGPGCLMLRCPDPSCNAAVGNDMFSEFVSDEDKEKYYRYLLRSYIETSKRTKWCPSPGCDQAVNFDISSSNYDVCCKCAYSFCWNCTEEAHRPVVCETVAKWILKNCAESENTNWILAYTKPCPKCSKPIEKNQGCMHMTCRPPCKYEFCWLCLGAWSDHRGAYSCNRYDTTKNDGVHDDVEMRREMAKKSLQRYTHYYERWATNQSSRKKALEDLRNMQTEKLEKLRSKSDLPASQLKFIIEAWEQIVECRRVLKWSYAYGYYLPEHENAKRQLFEYLQGEAEFGLERLHKCVEKELKVFFQAEKVSGTSREFTEFRIKLTDLTRITRNYFENLVRALETGLHEVKSSLDMQQATSSKASSRSKKRPRTISDFDYENWACSFCTYFNPRSTIVCQMCERLM